MSKVVEMYSMIIPNKSATVLVEHIFRVFDNDANGYIDFMVIKFWKRIDNIQIMIQEFMIATDMTSCGTPDEKLRWAFKMYDEDGSGIMHCTFINFIA